jgi:hypothetical protein
MFSAKLLRQAHQGLPVCWLGYLTTKRCPEIVITQNTMIVVRPMHESVPYRGLTISLHEAGIND